MTFNVHIEAALRTISVAASAPAAGSYQARLLSGDTVAAIATAAAPSFDFPAVPAGEYTAEMTRLDVNGAEIAGSRVTKAVSITDVPAETVDVDVPSDLTVTVTPE